MGSAFFQDFVPDHSATVAERLAEAGAVTIGKTNTHEFRLRADGRPFVFRADEKPHDAARITGGSSGGSGAAVATELVYGALGSDTGGSIRIPSALCGTVGMKPTVRAREQARRLSPSLGASTTSAPSPVPWRTTP
jgi:aspartyl-tRNA(Asn)/glutamyl-tRNA(Gln) amidotransferase subunit A